MYTVNQIIFFVGALNLQLQIICSFIGLKNVHLDLNPCTSYNGGANQTSLQNLILGWHLKLNSPVGPLTELPRGEGPGYNIGSLLGGCFSLHRFPALRTLVGAVDFPSEFLRS